MKLLVDGSVYWRGRGKHTSKFYFYDNELKHRPLTQLPSWFADNVSIPYTYTLNSEMVTSGEFSARNDKKNQNCQLSVVLPDKVRAGDIITLRETSSSSQWYDPENPWETPGRFFFGRIQIMVRDYDVVVFKREGEMAQSNNERILKPTATLLNYTPALDDQGREYCKELSGAFVKMGISHVGMDQINASAPGAVYSNMYIQIKTEDRYMEVSLAGASDSDLSFFEARTHFRLPVGSVIVSAQEAPLIQTTVNDVQYFPHGAISCDRDGFASLVVPSNMYIAPLATYQKFYLYNGTSWKTTNVYGDAPMNKDQTCVRLLNSISEPLVKQTNVTNENIIEYIGDEKLNTLSTSGHGNLTIKVEKETSNLLRSAIECEVVAGGTYKKLPRFEKDHIKVKIRHENDIDTATRGEFKERITGIQDGVIYFKLVTKEEKLAEVRISNIDIDDTETQSTYRVSYYYNNSLIKSEIVSDDMLAYSSNGLAYLGFKTPDGVNQNRNNTIINLLNLFTDTRFKERQIGRTDYSAMSYEITHRIKDCDKFIYFFKSDGVEISGFKYEKSTGLTSPIVLHLPSSDVNAMLGIKDVGFFIKYKDIAPFIQSDPERINIGFGSFDVEVVKEDHYKVVSALTLDVRQSTGPCVFTTHTVDFLVEWESIDGVRSGDVHKIFPYENIMIELPQFRSVKMINTKAGKFISVIDAATSFSVANDRQIYRGNLIVLGSSSGRVWKRVYIAYHEPVDYTVYSSETYLNKGKFNINLNQYGVRGKTSLLKNSEDVEVIERLRRGEKIDGADISMGENGFLNVFYSTRGGLYLHKLSPYVLSSPPSWTNPSMSFAMVNSLSASAYKKVLESSNDLTKSIVYKPSLRKPLASGGIEKIRISDNGSTSFERDSLYRNDYLTDGNMDDTTNRVGNTIINGKYGRSGYVDVSTYRDNMAVTYARFSDPSQTNTFPKGSIKKLRKINSYGYIENVKSNATMGVERLLTRLPEDIDNSLYSKISTTYRHSAFSLMENPGNITYQMSRSIGVSFTGKSGEEMSLEVFTAVILHM